MFCSGGILQTEEAFDRQRRAESCYIFDHTFGAKHLFVQEWHIESGLGFASTMSLSVVRTLWAMGLLGEFWPCESLHIFSIIYIISNADFSFFCTMQSGGILGKSFQKMRRRLTVTGASSTIDGSLKPGVEPSGDLKKYKRNKDVRAKPSSVITEFHGISKKGHAPYNPRKKNQDSLIMREDTSTNSMIFCTLDGHGEHGDHVSAWFRDRLVKEMSNHSAWVSNMKLAVADAISKVEKELLKNYRIDTEFSGTTLSMAIIRGNTLTGVNIGDSRVILGKEVGGRLEAVEITHDHKPDSPKEKERILASGGRVFAVEYDDGIDGPPRVWLGHMDVPGLAMSR